MDLPLDPAAKLIALCLHLRNKIARCFTLKHIAIVFFIYLFYSISGNSCLRLGKPSVNIENLHIKAT